MKNTREELKRRVIELIHGLPYKKAIKKERQVSFVTEAMVRQETGYFENGKYWEVYPITIGRVMQALNKLDVRTEEVSFANNGDLFFTKSLLELEVQPRNICNWKLTKEYGEECTDDDQNIETIEKLYSLLCD
jgi:hypothetical protein